MIERIWSKLWTKTTREQNNISNNSKTTTSERSH